MTVGTPAACVASRRLSYASGVVFVQFLQPEGVGLTSTFRLRP
jgi:hypothetical protein